MCNASGNYKSKHFNFYKDSNYIQTDNTHMHRIHSLDYANAGSYACDFWEVSYQSTRSKEITIFLTGKVNFIFISSFVQNITPSAI